MVRVGWGREGRLAEALEEAAVVRAVVMGVRQSKTVPKTSKVLGRGG